MDSFILKSLQLYNSQLQVVLLAVKTCFVALTSDFFKAMPKSMSKSNASGTSKFSKQSCQNSAISLGMHIEKASEGSQLKYVDKIAALQAEIAELSRG